MIKHTLSKSLTGGKTLARSAMLTSNKASDQQSIRRYTLGGKKEVIEGRNTGEDEVILAQTRGRRVECH